MALASLAPIALRALDVTDRPTPPALERLAGAVREAAPDLGRRQPFGQAAARIAAALRGGIYPD